MTPRRGTKTTWPAGTEAGVAEIGGSLSSIGRGASLATGAGVRIVAGGSGTLAAMAAESTVGFVQCGQATFSPSRSDSNSITPPQQSHGQNSEFIVARVGLIRCWHLAELELEGKHKSMRSLARLALLTSHLVISPRRLLQPFGLGPVWRSWGDGCTRPFPFKGWG